MASAHGFAERFKDALEHGPTMRARSVGKITVHVLEGGQPAIDLRESLEKSPEKLAAYFKSNPDPMILAALAGERSLDGLSGRPGSEPASEKVSRLEALAVRGAKEHLKLASDDPDLALKREKGWKAARAVACRGSHSESFSRMDAGYATAVKQAITLGHGRQPAVVPAVECAPKGIMRGVVFSKERQEGVAPAVVRQHVADLVDAPVAPELARERSRGRRESVSRVVKTVARGSGKALLYATVGPPAVVGYAAYRTGKFGYDKLAAGFRRVAGGGRAIAVAMRAHEVAARRRATSFSQQFKKAYVQSRDKALDKSRKMASAAGERVSDAAVKAAAKNPAAEARFRRKLVKAMERGPVAAEVFLEKVAASPVQTEIAKRAGLESVVVASAIGGSAVRDVLASKVPEGDRPIDKLVHVLQAEEQKRGFDAAESGGGPLGKTIAGQEKGLRQDPTYRAARDDLAARSLGFEPDSGKAVDVGRAWETRRELDGRFAEPVGDVGGHKIYPPDLLKENRAQLAGVVELAADGEAERGRRDARHWDLVPTPERPPVREDTTAPSAATPEQPTPVEPTRPAPADPVPAPTPDASASEDEQSPATPEQPTPVEPTVAVPDPVQADPVSSPTPVPSASEDERVPSPVTAEPATTEPVPIEPLSGPVPVVSGGEPDSPAEWREFPNGTRVHVTAEVADDAVLGRGVTVGAGADIESGVVVGDGADIGREVTLEAGSVVGREAQVGAQTIVREAAKVGPEVNLGRWTEVQRGADVGERTCVYDGCTVGEDAVLERDVRLDEGTVVGPKSHVGHHAHIEGYGAAGLGVNTGERASIGPNSFIGADCRFGYNVTVGEGAQVGSRVALRSRARIEPGAVVNDDSLVMFRATVKTDVPLPAGQVQTRAGVGPISGVVARGVNLEQGGPPAIDFKRAVMVAVGDLESKDGVLSPNSQKSGQLDSFTLDTRAAKLGGMVELAGRKGPAAVASLRKALDGNEAGVALLQRHYAEAPHLSSRRETVGVLRELARPNAGAGPGSTASLSRTADGLEAAHHGSDEQRARRLGHALVAAANTQGTAANGYIKRETAKAIKGLAPERVEAVKRRAEENAVSQAALVAREDGRRPAVDPERLKVDRYLSSDRPQPRTESGPLPRLDPPGTGVPGGSPEELTPVRPSSHSSGDDAPKSPAPDRQGEGQGR